MAPANTKLLTPTIQTYAYTTDSTNRSNVSLVEDEKVMADVMSLSQMIQQHVTNFYDINPRTNPKFYRKAKPIDISDNLELVDRYASEFANAPVSGDITQIDFMPKTSQCFEVALRRCIGKCILDYMDVYIKCGAPINLKRSILDCKLEPYADRTASTEKQRMQHITTIYELSQALAEVLWGQSSPVWKFGDWENKTYTYKTTAEQLEAPVFPALFKDDKLVMISETINGDVMARRVQVPVEDWSQSPPENYMGTTNKNAIKGSHWWKRGSGKVGPRMAKLYRRRKARPSTKRVPESSPESSLDHEWISDESDESAPYYTAESRNSSRETTPEKSMSTLKFFGAAAITTTMAPVMGPSSMIKVAGT